MKLMEVMTLIIIFFFFCIGQKSLLNYLIENYRKEMTDFVVEMTPGVFRYDVAANTIFKDMKKVITKIRKKEKEVFL